MNTLSNNQALSPCSTGLVPPSSNTGGKLPIYSPMLTGSLVTDWFRVVLEYPMQDDRLPKSFDWSPADSVSNPMNVLFEHVMFYTQNFHHIQHCKGRFNYDFKQSFINRENEVASTFFYGGNSGSILAESSGSASTDFMILITSLYLCRATRRDIAYDFYSEISIDEIHQQLEKITEHRWFKTDKGSGVTLENCSKRNGREFFIRVYEKGLQLGLGNNWVRCEVEVKIDKKHKARRRWLAHSSEDDIVNSNKDARIVFSHFMNSNVLKFKKPRTKKEEKSDLLEAILPHISKQYKKYFIDLLAHHDGNTNAMFFSLIRGELSTLNHNTTQHNYINLKAG